MADIDLNKVEAFAALEEETGDIIQSEEDRKEILDYVTGELGTIIDGPERKEMLQKVSKWRRQREARPETEEKSFPWTGASNITVPLALTSTNGIYAMLKASFSQRKPFWTVTAKNTAEVKKEEKIIKP
ncbi:hypothetical protein LCGC14_1611290 [marine sediment metagenome]|uniref:Uncharacterized protein n=1 Tax=marine sediment metagenome TaxID=412755 RepID=A0A0F9I8H3_9ZZZZ